MILNIKQTKNRPRPEYDIINNKTGEKFADANAFNVAKPQLILPNGNQYCVDITFRFTKRIDGKRKLVLDVLCNDNIVGAIYQSLVVQKKILFMPVGYDYFVLLIDNITLQIFEIGLGGDQHYLSFYNNDKIVAIVHKDMRVKDNLDTYTAFIENESFAYAVCLFTLYIDQAGYNNNGDVVISKESNEEYITLNQELNAKYDPTFIPRIKAMDDFSNHE